MSGVYILDEGEHILNKQVNLRSSCLYVVQFSSLVKGEIVNQRQGRIVFEWSVSWVALPSWFGRGGALNITVIPVANSAHPLSCPVNHMFEIFLVDTFGRRRHLTVERSGQPDPCVFPRFVQCGGTKSTPTGAKVWG